MKHMCPVCNAFTDFQSACPTCGQELDDSGRLYDYYGQYSPYAQIDDAKLTNGLADFSNHLCVHVGWCPVCRVELLVPIQERTDF